MSEFKFRDMAERLFWERMYVSNMANQQAGNVPSEAVVADLAVMERRKRLAEAHTPTLEYGGTATVERDGDKVNATVTAPTHCHAPLDGSDPWAELLAAAEDVRSKLLDAIQGRFNVRPGDWCTRLSAAIAACKAAKTPTAPPADDEAVKYLRALHDYWTGRYPSWKQAFVQHSVAVVGDNPASTVAAFLSRVGKPDPVREAERKVVEAAEKWNASYEGKHDRCTERANHDPAYWRVAIALSTATDALRAAREQAVKA